MAARGLDITGLPYVVNAEVPLSEELICIVREELVEWVMKE